MTEQIAVSGFMPFNSIPATKHIPAQLSNLLAQNASNFRKEVSKKDGSDKAGNIGSLNDQTPRSVGIEGGKIQDNIKNHLECQDEMGTKSSAKSLSECYFAGKGTALVLPDAEEVEGKKPIDDECLSLHDSVGRFSATSDKSLLQGNNTIQKHLQSMFYLLCPEDTLKMAVKLESVHSSRTRYLVVVSRSGSRGEESCLLGIDCNEVTTIGLVLNVLANTHITLDGDGGFGVSVSDRHHIFKPVSVQAMWSALQTLHKVSAKAREENYFQGGASHGWVNYYESKIESDRSCLNEWHAMDDLESKRPPSPDSIRTKPTEREETERVIRATLKEVMMSVDLDEVTSKVIRSRLEEELDMDLGEYKSFIDQEMLVILGQMDEPTRIFDHLLLGSEWNASNYEELQKNGVGHILNVTREIDNFFPGSFKYLNVRVYDDEKTDLLKHWDDTYKYITKAKNEGSKVLVHCKMGVSRSASVVIAYAMKANNWDFQTALHHVKNKRTCIKPNKSFLLQLETYQGILDAMKNKEKLQRSKSETNLKSPLVAIRKNESASRVDAPSAVLLQEMNLSGQKLQEFGARPKSWSPDDYSSRELMGTVKSSPVSVSLEDISQKSLKDATSARFFLSDASKSTLARHVFCDNGESYSVSPNQIVHLPGHDSATCRGIKSEKKNLVLRLATKFEGHDAQKSGDDVKETTWDPGEDTDGEKCDGAPSCCCSTSTNACDSDSQTMWNSSVTIKTENFTSSDDSIQVPNNVSTSPRVNSDPFSNQLDKVFDREEMKQNRVSLMPVVSSPELNKDAIPRDCPSRQSSWSSYDSAVAMNFQNELSRHSSWSSGDARNMPSRNSSWGSYDMRKKDHPVYYVDENGEKHMHSQTELENSSSGLFPYDKNDFPWLPGTVKRSKQKLPLRSTPSSETLLFDFPAVEPAIVVVEAVNPVLVDSDSSAISDKIDIPTDSRKCRSSSRLSISAPEASSMELISPESLSRSESNVSSMGSSPKESTKIISTVQVSSVKQQKTVLENYMQNSSQDSQTATKKSEDLIIDNSASGKVRNLKKEFEAKSEQIEIVELSKPSKTRVSSLPSSPVSVHVSKEKKLRDVKSTSEDINMRNLIGIFENKDDSHVNRRQKSTNSTNKPFSSNRNTRFSCIEVSTNNKTPRIFQSPTISLLNKTEKTNEGDCRRPPMVPTVRNPSTQGVQGLMVAATVINAAKKKQQQFGKSHPLARLNIKPRHNNPVYNTM